MDFSRLKQGEIVAGIGGVALFVFLFLDWFGAGDAGISGWDSLGGDISGFLVFLAAIAGMKLAGMAAMGVRLNIGLQRGLLTMSLGYLAAAIIVWRVLATPEGADIKFGLILGLAAALAITIGAALALREGGFEPVVPVPGGRTKAAAASAPAATPRRASSAPAKRKSTASKSSSRSSSRSKSSGSRSSSSTRKRSSGGRK